MTEEEMFNNLLSRDPAPGTKNRIKILDTGNVLVPGWMINSQEEYVDIGRKSTHHQSSKNGYNSQIMYDIGVLGLTSIDQRPRCPICGKPVKFEIFTRGYRITCNSKECRSKVSQVQVTDLWKDDKYRENMVQKHKDWASIEENKKLMSQNSKKMWENESYRDKLRNSHILWAQNNPDKIKSGGFKTGYQESSKSANKSLWYDSSWERNFIEYCNTQDFIISIERSTLHIPYLWEEVERNYFPDFEITIDTGEIYLVEIKPEYMMSEDLKTQAKLFAGQVFVNSSDKYNKYLVLSENQLFLDGKTSKKFNNTDSLKNYLLATPNYKTL